MFANKTNKLTSQREEIHSTSYIAMPLDQDLDVVSLHFLKICNLTLLAYVRHGMLLF